MHPIAPGRVRRCSPLNVKGPEPSLPSSPLDTYASPPLTIEVELPNEGHEILVVVVGRQEILKFQNLPMT